jgi:GAF domain-containing protein
MRILSRGGMGLPHARNGRSRTQPVKKKETMNAETVCAELQRQRDLGVDLDDILTLAVSLLHESTPRFHWTGIYELFPDRVLRLGPFLGAPTDHVFIGVGEGVCGTAVAEQRNMNVPDVTKAQNYLACSTATRSELVVLIRDHEQIYAQIDIDSHELDAFDPAVETEVEKVATWLAVLYRERESVGVRAL